MCANRDRETDPRFQNHCLLSIPKRSPHLTSSTYDVPDLLYSMVRNGNRSLAGCELEVCNASSLELKQRSHI